MSTIRMWQYAQSGPIEKALSLSTTAQGPKPPTATSNEILVEVLATSLNPVDYKLAEIPILGPLLVRRFTTPGLDFSGRVASTPSSSSDLSKGDLVAGRLPGPRAHGSLSQFVTAPRSGLAKLASNVSPEQGAALGTAGMTAYQSLVPFVKAGDTVFVNGGSGGVGTFAVQIGKLIGCRVVTSCSGANVQLCRDLGADRVVDYRNQDLVGELRKEGQVFDLVVDLVGKPYDLHSRSEGFLKPGGKFVQIGAAFDLSTMKSVVTSMALPGFLGGTKRSFQLLAVSNQQKDFDQLASWTADGKLKVIIDSVFPYSQVPQAFEKLKTGRARGKVIVSHE